MVSLSRSLQNLPARLTPARLHGQRGAIRLESNALLIGVFSLVLLFLVVAPRLLDSTRSIEDDLQRAVVEADIDGVRTALDRGARVNHQFPWLNSTVLHSSAWRDQPAITLLLLEAGADPNLRDSHSGETALHAAVRGNNRAAVELLRAHGADLSIALTAQSEQCASGLVHPAGSTALDIASRSGYAEIVRVLGR